MMAATQIPNDLKMGREYALLGKYVNALPSYACSFPVLSSCLVWVIVWGDCVHVVFFSIYIWTDEEEIEV